jgi:Tol biopolymer transport system component
MKHRNILRSALALMVCGLMLAALPGCSRQAKPIEATSTEAPASSVKGYFNPEQVLTGGSDIDRLNLRDIEVKRQDEDLVVILTFMEGSARMDMNEAPAAGVPQYTTRWYPGVDRLAISFEGLAFWDYRIYPNEIENTVISGIFKQLPVNSETTVLYLNTRDSFAYRMESVGNQLMIYLRPQAQEEVMSWYVAIDGFAEYTQGQVPEELTLAPTLCEDLGNVILLSAPFADEQQARQFLEENADALAQAVPGKQAAVLELGSNRLPPYDESTQLKALLEKPVSRLDGQSRQAQSFIENGRFLCWHPNGQDFLFVRPIMLSSTQEDNVYIQEQLWTGNADEGTVSAVLDYDFISILKAEYSPDGKYIAFLEQTDNERVLQIVEVDTGSISIAAEDEFGIDTSDFVWDEQENKLYGITGEVGAMQLMCYDLTGGSDDVSVSALEEEPCYEGDITLLDGALYYSQSNIDSMEGQILRFDLATGTKKTLTSGYSLSRAPQGECLSILDTSTTANEEDNGGYSLKVYDLATGKESIVDNSHIIVDSAWSADGTHLYYTIYRDLSSLEDEFPLSLFSYDTATGENRYVMDLITGALYPGQNPDCVLLMYIHDQMGRSVAITYRIDTK